MRSIALLILTSLAPCAVVTFRISRSFVSLKTALRLSQFDNDITDAKSILLEASEKRLSDSDVIVDSLLKLEKLMRKKNSDDKGATGEEVLRNLNGEWRLIFTTGTVDMQKKLTGRINFFPLKAIQSFDTSNFAITNGIYVGDFPVIKFFGPFEFNIKSKKLTFDFNDIAIFGIKISLPKGGAAKIGSSTGLGSENNVELVEKGKQPFFNWISADSDIATARGGGGGLALWKRVSASSAALSYVPASGARGGALWFTQHLPSV